jgi:hypothetical protein
MAYSRVLFEGQIGSRFFKVLRGRNKSLTLVVADAGDMRKTLNISFLPKEYRKWLLLMTILSQAEAEIIIPHIAERGLLL